MDESGLGSVRMLCPWSQSARHWVLGTPGCTYECVQGSPSSHLEELALDSSVRASLCTHELAPLVRATGHGQPHGFPGCKARRLHVGSRGLIIFGVATL